MTNEQHIATLHESMQGVAKAFIDKAAAQGYNLKIAQSLRTYEEQDRLYAQGRTAPGNIVTNARGGYSWHNFGLAIDVIDAVHGYNPPQGDGFWNAIGAIGESLGLEWGGRWTSFKDRPHFQRIEGLSLADARAGKRPLTNNEFIMDQEARDEFKKLNDRMTDTQNHIQKIENMATNKEGKNRWQRTGTNITQVIIPYLEKALKKLDKILDKLK